MSQRVILELNLDHLHALQWDEQWWTNLLARLGGCHYNADLNEANAEGKPIHIGHGVRLVMQRHHSDDATVKSQYVEIKL